MDCKDKITYIILGYLNGEYNIKDFCNLYEEYYEELDTDKLSVSSRIWFQNLWEMCSRFSDFKEDVALYPGVYFTEDEIRRYMQKFSVDKFRNKQ